MQHGITDIRQQKWKTDTIVGILCLLFVILISTVAAVWAVPRTLAAKVNMEVYQQADGKVFGRETSLDIFKNGRFDDEKLVAPYSTGSYTFAVLNTAASSPLPYTLKFFSDNPEEIPLIFSLQKNGEYIYGGAEDNSMLTLTELNFTDNQLGGSQTDLYTLHWRWKTYSDEEDTALGNLANERDLIYKLTVTATGTISDEILPDDDKNQKDNDNDGNGTNGVIRTLRKLWPKTGDVTSIMLWVVLTGIALTLIIWFWFFRRRKKDEDNENNQKDR